MWLTCLKYLMLWTYTALIHIAFKSTKCFFMLSVVTTPLSYCSAFNIWGGMCFLGGRVEVKSLHVRCRAQILDCMPLSGGWKNAAFLFMHWKGPRTFLDSNLTWRLPIWEIQMGLKGVQGSYEGGGREFPSATNGCIPYFCCGMSKFIAA